MKNYKNLPPFKWFCLTNFPFIEADFDALTNYELLCKIVQYLNEVIVKTNELGEQVEILTNWFNNLDVQDEIDKKLDEMVEDGQLTEIVKDYFSDLENQVTIRLDSQDNVINQSITLQNNRIEEGFETQDENLETAINNQNNKINIMETKINAVTNGSPLVVSSVSDMTDTSKIYVNTTDGKWYYYTNGQWTIGGTYQSTGIGNGTVNYKNLAGSLKNSIELLEDDVFNNIKTTYESNDVRGLIKMDGTILASTSNNWGYVTAEVNSPRKVKIYGSMGVNNPNHPLVAFYNSNVIGSDSLISVITSTSANNEQLVEIDVPTGTVLIAVNSWAINTKIPKIIVTTYSSDVFEKTYTYDFVEDEEAVSGTTGFNKLGAFVNVNHSLKGEIGTAKKVRVTGSGGGYIPIVAFADQYNNYVTSYQPTTDWIKQTEVFDVPDTAYYVYAQDWNNVGLKLELSEENDATLQSVNEKVNDLINNNTTTDVEFNTQNWKQKLIEEQEKNDFAWQTFDKAYISFTFDDLRDDISSIIDLFNTKNIKLCLAVPPSRLGATLTGGETGKEACQRVVTNGGEILSHDTNVLTFNSTDADYKRQFYTDKKLLTEAGFNINGVILAGGENYLTADFNKCVRYMRPYFNYSDLYGYNTGVTQYYHPRTWISATESENESAIQDAITNKTWLSFASHGTSEVSLALLGTLLDYINTLNSDDVEVVTFFDLYNAKKSSKLEERIKALES